MKKLYCFFICCFLFLARSGAAFSKEVLSIKSSSFPSTVTNPNDIPDDWFETNACVIKKNTNDVIWSEGYITKDQIAFTGNSTDFFLNFDTGQFKRVTVYFQNEEGNWFTVGKTGNLVSRSERSVEGIIYTVRVKVAYVKENTKIRIKSELYYQKPFSVRIYSSREAQKINDYCLIGYSLFLGIQLLSILVFLFMFQATRNKLFLVSSVLSLSFMLFVLTDSDLDFYFQFTRYIKNGDYFNYNIVLLVIMCVMLFFKESMQFHFFGRNREYGRGAFWFFLVLSLLVIGILILPFSSYMFIFGQFSLLLTLITLVALLIYTMIVNEKRRFYAFSHIVFINTMLIRSTFFILRATYPDFIPFSIADNDYLITYIIFSIFFTGDSFLYLGFSIEKKSKKKELLINERDKNAEKAEITFTSLEMISENIHKALETIRGYESVDTGNDDSRSLVIDKSLLYIEIYNNIQNVLFMERKGTSGNVSTEDVIHLRPFLDYVLEIFVYQLKYKNVTINSQVNIDSKIVVQTNRNLFENMLRLLMIVVDCNTISNSTVYIKSGFSNGSFSFSITFDCNEPHEEELNTLLTMNPQNPSQEEFLNEWGVNLYLVSCLTRILNGSFNCFPAKNGLTISTGFVLKSSIFYPKNISENTLENVKVLPHKYESENKKAVLVADFSLGFRIVMADRLNKEFTVYTAGNGQDAFDTLYSKKIDAVVISEKISVMSIETFMEAFRKNPDFAHIPLFVIVDFLTQEKSRYYYERGAVLVTDNPLSSDDFLMAIRNTLRIVDGKGEKEIKTEPASRKTFAETKKPSKRKNEIEGLSQAQDEEFTKAGLTKKEKLVAVYISQGLSDKEISDITGISAATVAVHNRNIFKKLGIHKRSELLH